MLTEVPVYIPTPQETAVIPEVQSQKSAPFAFDLAREYQLAQEYGENYKKLFIDNAHYYAKESYGRVPVSEYEHRIVENIDGTIRLTFGEQNVSARESYLSPVMDNTKPDWYKRRSIADVTWVDSLEEKLIGAEEGDTFVDLSPTEYNVTVEERKKWGYGYHSFVRIHRITIENGQKKLVSRAVRNYLDAPEQEVLFEQLTSEKTSVLNLLGRVVMVNSGISQTYIKTLCERLYDSTPQHRKIIPPAEYTLNIKNEQEMDSALSKIDVWLEAVYQMMEEGADKREILSKFRGWEHAIKDFVSGKSRLKEFEGFSVRDMHRAMYSKVSIVTDYINRPYESVENSCGNGSGFGELEKKEEPMTYESMTKSIQECPEIKCRKCKWKASEAEVKKINEGKLNKCPDCGWKP